MNKYLEKKIKEASKEFGDKKKSPTTPEKQFEKGALWMYNFIMNGEAVNMYRQTLTEDVIDREGGVKTWKKSLIDELADMLAERDAMNAEIRETGRLITKIDKNMNEYQESNPLYVHVKAKEQSISVWRDKLGLSNTVPPDRIKDSPKNGGDDDSKMANWMKGRKK